ncbi:MAG TPA: FKBP-type peptidyl-prolyl cis-trans isomerase [Bacteroidia bacterium]|nr:FKBP-type peptidyl-prolyl cis-trans isomerase [Bacteroidia bacterium]
MKTIATLFLSAIMLLVFSCEEEKPKAKKDLTKEEADRLSREMNAWDVDRQQDEIRQYIARNKWDMKETKSGVYYMLMSAGNGDSAHVGQTAEVTYDIYLLDGTKCYSSGNEKKEFVIGEDYIESGLHEGIQLMRVGDQMRFILPSYLAHGLTGDQDKIPARSSVLYEVKLHALH